MDTIVDSYGHAILTLTERSTNFILMERIRLLFPYRTRVRTITTDNGCEFAAHRAITEGLTRKGEEKIVVYFTDSYAAWQKGAIENANKLIRKYIPKKANFNDFTDAYIKNVQHKINRRPREKLCFESPKRCFFRNFD